MKAQLALLLLASALAAPCVVLAQDKAESPPAKKPAAEKPVLKVEKAIEIKRTGPPDCVPKPVMTDAEIERCKKAAGK